MLPVSVEAKPVVSDRKYDRNSCRGFYKYQGRGQPAWIRLVTDNIVAGPLYCVFNSFGTSLLQRLSITRSVIIWMRRLDQLHVMARKQPRIGVSGFSRFMHNVATSTFDPSSQS
jgi:hypothetical protein